MNRLIALLFTAAFAMSACAPDGSKEVCRHAVHHYYNVSHPGSPEPNFTVCGVPDDLRAGRSFPVVHMDWNGQDYNVPSPAHRGPHMIYTFDNGPAIAYVARDPSSACNIGGGPLNCVLDKEYVIWGGTRSIDFGTVWFFSMEELADCQFAYERGAFGKPHEYRCDHEMNLDDCTCVGSGRPIYVGTTKDGNYYVGLGSKLYGPYSTGLYDINRLRVRGSHIEWLMEQFDCDIRNGTNPRHYMECFRGPRRHFVVTDGDQQPITGDEYEREMREYNADKLTPQ